MFGFAQSPIEDLAARWFFRAVFEFVSRNDRLYLKMAELIVPTTVPVVAHAILGVPASSPVTMTPREAQARYGYDIPAEAHRALRAKQEERVFGRGEAPSDEGLIESQQFIGSMTSSG
jgi:hypothetical protein